MVNTVYEYRTLKPIEVILRRGGGRGRIMEGMNQMGHTAHIHGNVTMNPLYNKYILIKMF
jgi:hypothetical protein